MTEDQAAIRELDRRIRELEERLRQIETQVGAATQGVVLIRPAGG